MDIFGILNLLGGLALFLYGMSAMGDGLVQLSGGRLEKILEKLTQKKIMAVPKSFISASRPQITTE